MAFNISYVYEIINKASAPLQKIARSQKKVGDAAVKTAAKVKKSSRSQQSSITSLSDVAVRAAGITAAAFAIAMPIKKAIAFESAMADVAKVVEFKEPDGLKKMGATIKALSAELPITQEGLAAIVAQGGQLGVPADQLAEFAKQAAKMSIAFDIAPDAAAEAMAKLSNILGIPITEMTKVGDAINFVSNNAAASAEDIVTAMKSGAGAGARALGLTADQAIALSTQFIAQGLSASEAGTRIQILARNLLDTEKTTKLVSAGFTRMVKKSPQKAIEKLLDAVAAGKIPHANLTELLGRTVNDFTLLAKNGDAYQKILGMVSDKTKFAGSMQAEFENRAATTDNQMILLRNSINNIAINIGTVFLPAVNEVVKIISSAANTVATFVETFPNFTKGLGAIATAILVVKAATLAWTIGQWALNVALAANPIGLIVIALAAAIALVVAFSDEIGSFISELLGVESIAKSIASLFGFGDDEEKTITIKKIEEVAGAPGGGRRVPEVRAPGATEMNGRLGVDINLAGNTEAVESVAAKPLGNGNLGVNMGAVTQ